MLDFLYTIFIYPVYMFVEFILFIANNISMELPQGENKK
ncbi:hypothetical protein HMPREF9733_02187 [Treponema denticola SP33]|uniref:Uncharacterized protein n=1 Tax=Treponema denticola SP33 TaxID=999437 RepID=M2AXM5_TREDN|nr:hypothetical protein HMPREF9733_02187 [Treponema denticola SP33]EPF36029.1 hypothetical protein HMPREF9732_02263 [Treponema denticola SP32]